MYEIKNIDSVSLGKSLAMIGGSVFLASAVCFVVLAIGFGEIDLDDLLDEEVFMFLGVGFTIAVVGFFIGGLIGATAYNYISSRLGGIKLDIDYHDESNGSLPGEQQNGSNVRQ